MQIIYTKRIGSGHRKNTIRNTTDRFCAKEQYQGPQRHQQHKHILISIDYIEGNALIFAWKRCNANNPANDTIIVDTIIIL